jgi:tryptophanyl-tRNA synthetase
MDKDLLKDNEKLVKEFGAKRISDMKDFDKFLKAIKNKEKCAIVSGANASGTLHLGHKVVFDTNLYFQQKYGIPIFVPISDDESYVAGKVETQEKALEYSKELAKQFLAYGFDPKNTYFIIDKIIKKSKLL